MTQSGKVKSSSNTELLLKIDAEECRRSLKTLKIFVICVSNNFETFIQVKQKHTGSEIEKRSIYQIVSL